MACVSQLKEGAQIHVYQLTADAAHSDSSADIQIPDTLLLEVKQLLEKYSDVFASKVTYPPTRASNHSIPLLHGATPIHIRPYRYTPALKNEIERKIQEMLQTGLIQHSNSPFSSPVLLVKR
jgi:hypothetical protein